MVATIAAMAVQAPSLKAISSMATRAVLAELAAACEAATGVALAVESVGGVDAAKRVASSAESGESFDLVFLASDALDKLLVGAQAPFVSQRVDLMRSAIAVAVPEGSANLDISSGDAVRNAVIAAPSIGYSTGPSGTYLQGLFARWGLSETVAAKLVKPPPGTPVAKLIASGDVALGFQQVSELAGVPGVRVLGELPPDVAYITTFSGAVATSSQRAGEAAKALAFLASPAAAPVKTRHGFALPV